MALILKLLVTLVAFLVTYWLTVLGFVGVPLNIAWVIGPTVAVIAWAAFFNILAALWRRC